MAIGNQRLKPFIPPPKKNPTLVKPQPTPMHISIDWEAVSKDIEELKTGYLINEIIAQDPQIKHLLGVAIDV